MIMKTLEQIADEADVILNGFAVQKIENDWYRVFNLNKGNTASVFMKDGELVETNMDDIELVIAKEKFQEALTYIEEYAKVS